MHGRRGFLGVIGTAGVVSLAGCALIEGTFERDASPAGVGEEALDSTGFEHREAESMAFEETVTALGQSRDLRLTNWLVSYGKEIAGAGADGSIFRLFSTPSITIAGSEINPFHDLGDRALLGEVDEDSSADEFEEKESQTVETLDEDVTYTRYETERQFGGQSVSTSVYVGRFSHDGDLLTAIGAHPDAVDESENIYELAEAIEHPVAFE